MKVFFKSFGPALLSGFLLGVSFPAWNVYPLVWVALVPLLWRAHTLTPREAFLHFTIAGWVTHSILLQWVLVQVFFAGGWAVVGLAGGALYFGLWWGFAGFLWKWLRTKNSRLGGPAAFALLWAAMETLQSVPQTTYGSAAILAHTQGPNLPLLQWATIGGAPLIALIIIFTNASIAEFIRTPKRGAVHLVVAAVMAFGAHLAGNTFINPAQFASPPFRVGIFQSDFPVEMKHDPEYTEEMVRSAVDKSIVLARNERIDLMVWPEALIMDDIDSPRVRDQLARFFAAAQVPLFTGSPRVAGNPPRAYNSAHLLNASGQVEGIYDKMQLAPFGEYVPFSAILPLIKALVPSAAGGLASGNDFVVLDVDDRKLGPLICFEVFFPHMAATLRARGADFLCVVTNLGWFGASNAIPQEFNVARLRAIETRLPLVHAANTGVSGVFDPYGRFTQMNSGVDRFGNYYHINADIDPLDTIQHRLISAFDLPNAVPHPFPQGPRIIPWLLVALSALLLATAFLPSPNPRALPHTLVLVLVLVLIIVIVVVIVVDTSPTLTQTTS